MLRRTRSGLAWVTRTLGGIVLPGILNTKISKKPSRFGCLFCIMIEHWVMVACVSVLGEGYRAKVHNIFLCSVVSTQKDTQTSSSFPTTQGCLGWGGCWLCYPGIIWWHPWEHLKDWNSSLWIHPTCPVAYFNRVPRYHQSEPQGHYQNSGATMNHCIGSEACWRGFKIYHNGWLSKLGNGEAKLKGI